MDSRLWLNISKQNTVYFFFSKEEKDLCNYVITLEVYNVKALEMYNVKALELYNVKTLEVFIYVLFIQVLEILCV